MHCNIYRNNKYECDLTKNDWLKFYFLNTYSYYNNRKYKKTKLNKSQYDEIFDKIFPVPNNVLKV